MTGAADAKNAWIGALVAFAIVVVLITLARIVHAVGEHPVASVTTAIVVLVALAVRAPVARSFGRRRVDGASVPVPLAKLRSGEAVHTAGLVGVGTEPRPALLGAPPCVWFHVVVEAVETREVLFESRSEDVLVLGDGSGETATVSLDGATMRLGRTLEIADERVGAFLAARGISAPSAVRARVEWIAPHELVFVRGTVQTTDGPEEVGYRALVKAERKIVSTEATPLVIALEPLTP